MFTGNLFIPFLGGQLGHVNPGLHFQPLSYPGQLGLPFASLGYISRESHEPTTGLTQQVMKRMGPVNQHLHSHLHTNIYHSYSEIENDHTYLPHIYHIFTHIYLHILNTLIFTILLPLFPPSPENPWKPLRPKCRWRRSQSRAPWKPMIRCWSRHVANATEKKTWHRKTMGLC